MLCGTCGGSCVRLLRDTARRFIDLNNEPRDLSDLSFALTVGAAIGSPLGKKKDGAPTAGAVSSKSRKRLCGAVGTYSYSLE